MKKKNNTFLTTRMIMLGFFCAIIAGSILLTLPIASESGEATPFVDALFMSTTSVCVTGLVTVNVVEHWNLFGEIVIFVLIQLGGLGVVTFSAGVLLVLGKRISLKERLLLQDSFNVNTMSGLVRMTRRVIKGVFVVEAFGAVVYFICLLPECIKEGAATIPGYIWKSVFLSVSAFCNAGMDLFGASSLVGYQSHLLMNINTMFLIIVGGIGFPVWWDIVDTIAKIKKEEINPKGCFAKLTLHTRFVFCLTIGLIVAGALFTLVFEYNNADTIGNMSFGDKLLASVFQSVTTRTAGFCTIPQDKLRSSTSLISMIFMFIGGSPGGTAGGIKTATMGVLVLSALSAIKNSRDVELFGRRLPEYLLKKALAVTAVSFTILLVATIALSAVEHGDMLDMLYETTSAIATVGLSRNITSTLTVAGKIIIILCMYLGRIGPITLALALNPKRSGIQKTLPEGDIHIG